MNTEEKYVSIEYETWHNKYLPMEHNLSLLRAELENEKRNKSGTLYIETAIFYNYPNSYYGTMLGSIDFSIRDAPQLSLDTRRIFTSRIRDLYGGQVKFVTPEELVAFKKGAEERIKISREIYEKNQLLIKKIPRIIKWLFKIKS